MKTPLNINSPVGQRLAQIALFERIQAMLNLDISQIIKSLGEYSRKNGLNTIDVAEEVREVAPMLIGAILQRVEAHLRGGTQLTEHHVGWIVRDDFANRICHHLKWFPYVLMSGIQNKAYAENIDPAETAQYLSETAPVVVEWVFDQVIKVLKRGKK
jgi:hypothetical protein